MALVATIDFDAAQPIGVNLMVFMFSLAFDSSYLTGGELAPDGLFLGDRFGTVLHVFFTNTKGFDIEYDAAADTFKAYTEEHIEVEAEVDLSALTDVGCFAIGTGTA